MQDLSVYRAIVGLLALALGALLMPRLVEDQLDIDEPGAATP